MTKTATAVALTIAVLLVLAMLFFCAELDSAVTAPMPSVHGGGDSRTTPAPLKPGAADPSNSADRTPADPATILIVVQTTNESRIPGALVRLESAAEFPGHTSRTDATGECTIPAHAAMAASVLRVSANGYVPTSMELHARCLLFEARGTIVITLVVGAAISGTVETVGGDVVGAGVVVEALSGDPLHGRSGVAAARAVTDDRGRFTLSPLEDGEHYWIEARDRRASSRPGDRLARYVAPEANARLVLRDLYGVRLEFHCEDEAYLSRMYRDPQLRLTFPAAFQRYLGWNASVASLTSGRPDKPCTEQCLPLVFWLNAPGDPTPRVVDCRGEIPGFEPFELKLILQPVEGGRLEAHPVALVPDAIGIGGLALALNGSCAEFAAQHGMSGHLKLTRLADSRTLSFPVAWGGGSSVAEVLSVPAGWYRWELSIESGWLRIGAQKRAEDHADDTVSVLDGETTPLAVTLPEVGYIKFECYDANGPVQGRVHLANGVVFGGGTPRATWMRELPAGKDAAVVGPLPPGEYTATLSDPVPAREGPHTVTVEAGTIRTEVFVIQ